LDLPGVERIDRLHMVIDPGMHRPNQRDIVNDIGQVGQQLGKLHAALAMFLELPSEGRPFWICPVLSASIAC